MTLQPRPGRAALHLVAGLALLALLGGACGGSGAPVAALDGTWAGRTGPQGTSLNMTLAQRGTIVSGNGTYGGDAGLAGHMAISGTTAAAATGTQVDLSFTLDDNTTGTFTGALTYLRLTGTWTHAGASTALTFNQQ